MYQSKQVPSYPIIDFVRKINRVTKLKTDRREEEGKQLQDLDRTTVKPLRKTPTKDPNLVERDVTEDTSGIKVFSSKIRKGGSIKVIFASTGFSREPL